MRHSAGTSLLLCVPLSLLACSTTVAGGDHPDAAGVLADAATGADAPSAKAAETLAEGLDLGTEGTSFVHANLAIDPVHVYLSRFGASPDYGTGAVLEIAKQAGGTPAPLADAQPAVQFLSTDGTTVFFSSYYGGFVAAVPAAGGAVTRLAEGLASPVHTAVDADRLYFAENGASKIRWVGKGGGDVTTLASDQVTCLGLALDDASVYWVSWGSGVAQGVIRKVAKAGGEPIDVASALDQPDNLAVDATDIYFRAGKKAIAKVATAGGIVTVLQAGATELAGPVIDGSDVYWADVDDGIVYAEAKAGGAPRMVAVGEYKPFALAVDDGYVYWVNGLRQADNVLRRVAKSVTP